LPRKVFPIGLSNREIKYMLDNGMGDYLPKKVKSGMEARRKAGLSELDTGANGEPKGDDPVEETKKIDASATTNPIDETKKIDASLWQRK
jgi:hypothetical protein